MSLAPEKVKFQYMDMFRASFEIFKANAGILIGVFVFQVFISMLLGMTYIGQHIVMGSLNFGFCFIALNIVRGKPAVFYDYFAGFKVFLPTFLTYILISIFTLIGIICCVIPGLILAICYMPVYFFLIDGEDSAWQAMERSRKMVWNNFGAWLLLFLFLLIINILGLIPCGLGLLVTVPLSLLMTSMAYEQERSQWMQEQTPPPLPENAPLRD